MAEKVFISHKRIDSPTAERVAQRVRANGLATYLDVVDDALMEDGPDLADTLLRRMGECSQLIAVVSSSTKISWWVPWEIGVGSEKGFRMASYANEYVDLPSYLLKWPALRSLTDVDTYCRISKENEIIREARTRYITDSGLTLRVRKALSEEFHKRLKTELRAR